MHGGVLLVANTVPYFGADTVMMLLCAVSGVPAYTALLTRVVQLCVARWLVNNLCIVTLLCPCSLSLSLQDTVACLGRVEYHRVFNLFDALGTVSALAVQREGSSVSGTMNAMLENLSSHCAWLTFVPSPTLLRMFSWTT